LIHNRSGEVGGTMLFCYDNGGNININ